MRTEVDIPDGKAFVTYCGWNDARAIEFCVADTPTTVAVYTDENGLEVLSGNLSAAQAAALMDEGETLLSEWNQS